ncbi:MAG: T9SS type A sorting domain-containing protein [Bacteroidetes bacterium]|nr:T9SS type A sorting domain-containing protein [Bacteroidota bacterium]
MLIAALLPNVLRAQTSDLRSFIINDGAEYRGHIMTPHLFVNMPPTGTKDGYLAIGNRTAGSSRDQVHLLCIPDASTGIAVTGYNIDVMNATDLRAVAITPAGTSAGGNPANALVLQARGDQNIPPDHIDVLLTDASDPGAVPMIYNAYRLVDQAGGNLYPTSAVFDGNQTLFICGIYTTTSPYPNEPTLADSKEAFVASLDLTNGTTNFMTYSSMVNTTFPLPIAPWGGNFNDYDAALRMRIINGNLMVVGSANGTATTLYHGAGSVILYRQVNYSETWVANIDMSSLNITSQSKFGTQQAPEYTTPENGEGTYGLDIMEDKMSSNGDYYVVQNRVTGARNNFLPGWYLTHIDSLGSPTSLLPTNVGSNPNTLFDTTYFTGKMLGAVRHTDKKQPSRITMYGIMLPWMTAMSFDVSFSPSGISFTNPAWWWYSSTSGGSMGVVNPDFWLSSDLNLWSLPDMAAPYGAGSNPDYLGLMDYSFKSVGLSQPRFIQGGADGEYVSSGSRCAAWINNGVSAPGINFRSVSGGMTNSPGTLMVDNPQAEINDRPHTIYSCNNGDPYRLTHNKPNANLQADAWQVQPNPASDYIVATWGGTLNSEDFTSLRLLDMTGRAVYAATAHPVGNSVRYSLPRLAPGLYMATFTINGMSAQTIKLSIQQ